MNYFEVDFVWIGNGAIKTIFLIVRPCRLNTWKWTNLNPRLYLEVVHTILCSFLLNFFYLLCTQGLSLFLYTFVQYHKYLGPVLKKVHFKELYPVLVTTIGYRVCQGYLIQKWRGRLTKPSIRTQITFKNILSMNWPNAADCSLSSNLSEKHLSRANLG